jgi:plasmid stabilization system protein ParE
MEKYQLTPEAVSDLLEICDFINQDNPDAARPGRRRVYDPEKKPLQIIRILHGARDLPLC